MVARTCTNINQSRPSVVTFQVPDDARPLTLVGKRDFC